MKKQRINGENPQKRAGAGNKIALRGGGYSLLVTAVVLAIVIVVNILANALPATWTKLDISASQLYSITSNTKVVLNHLQNDVTIYWIVQADQEDSIIENLLAKYEALSSHVTVMKKNPDVFPTFTEQYTDEQVPNNSLIVECGEKSRYISYDEIYLRDVDLYSYQYTTSFDGEGAITSAIDYVVSEDLPQIYLLEGHGESDLPATFADQVEKGNTETQQLSLLSLEAVPEDADCVMIYAPTSDISETERDMLQTYVASGGKLMVLAGPTQDTSLVNLNSLIETYGVTVKDGIVVEEEQSHFFFGYPYLLLPDLQSSEATDPLIEDRYSVIMSLSNGLQISSYATSVTSLMNTSDTAFCKTAGYALTTYDKEDEDIEGPFSLAVSIADGSGGGIVWFASSDFLDDAVNAYSSGANGDLAMNALAGLIGETEAMAIRSKSLNYNYLTISESTSSTLKFLMIGAIPLAYFGVGLVILLRRRGKQNETV